ncbi:hypothetical protein Gorai_015406 [Gossypium raimondii]|uniref:Uncharacterized protein n=1 Tax=Gossypium raimondii TaxID=29730 RepID=A0A7J8P6Q5_GOSRA|nr:hypothetical protein [Gossypium raimondii]
MKSTYQLMGGSIRRRLSYEMVVLLKSKKLLPAVFLRALTAIVTALRLPIPISTLEQGMGRLLETMSFV